MKINSQKREGNKVFLEIEEDYSGFQKSYEGALAEAGRETNLPGFRPGKAPREVLLKSLNLEAVEHHAAQDLIADSYPKIINETKIEPVDYPNVEIIQQEKDKPFKFKLTVEVYPEVKLGKYKGLKLEKKTGDAAEAEADLKNQAVAVASAEAKVEIPAALTEREIEVMLDELKGSLAQGGLTLENYLQGAKKEEKALRDEMRKSAEIRAKGKIVLKAIAEAEKITVSPGEIEAEIKDMNLPEAKVSKEMKNYIDEYLLRKKALDFVIEKAEIK